MSDPITSILLAEDDLNLGVLLLDFLEAEGFRVKLCKDGEFGWKAFEEGSYDLCLLDVMMPRLDGFSLAQKIRATGSNVPIIFITAKSLREDKLLGYDIGADDYITKPFDEEELVWKIKAILKRVAESGKRETGNEEREAGNVIRDLNESLVNGVIRIGKYEFEYQNLSLSFNGQLRRITEKEADILRYLYINRNKLIKREQMLEELWGVNDYFLGRSLDVFITKIRKYLKEDATLSIENVFKVGFVFNAPEEAS